MAKSLPLSSIGSSSTPPQNIVVIGGGHAGIEAALASSRMGVSTYLVTLKKNRIGYMSCNPAIGGIAKGQLVREIDALGGEMGSAIDRTGIQFKYLNSKKGPAVRSPRAQADKELYALYMQLVLEKSEYLKIIEGEVTEIDFKSFNGEENVTGVYLEDGSRISCGAVIVTAGTFLRAVMHIGEKISSGGRVGDRATSNLSEQLLSYGLELGRFKTGTPPRLFGKSIDWEKCIIQNGDEHPRPFSHFNRPRPFPLLTQKPCYLTKTNLHTHEVILNNLSKSPLFSGQIKSLGPRYCPSIEDKVTRFSDKNSHQIFLEPEGLKTDSVYINGVSTSLPAEVQLEFLRTIPGLKNVELRRPGYAVEYDYILSRQLSRSLEFTGFKGLFFAGQVNGTSGYEEAAAQGLMAGINAVKGILNVEPFHLSRKNSYIGVLIDDLIVKGTPEPYRMFTSRAEHRLFLRSDNADERLCPLGYSSGSLKSDKWEVFLKKQEFRKRLEVHLKETFLFPDEEYAWISPLPTSPLKEKTSYWNLLRRPEVKIENLVQKLSPNVLDFWGELHHEVLETTEIAIRYEGYLKRESDLMGRVENSRDQKIPRKIEYGSISGLSREVVEILEKTRPDRMGALENMPGVTPAAIAVLSIYLRQKKSRKIKEQFHS